MQAFEGVPFSPRCGSPLLTPFLTPPLRITHEGSLGCAGEGGGPAMSTQPWKGHGAKPSKDF